MASLDSEKLKLAGEGFLKEVQDRLKDRWQSIPEETKQDIQETGLFAAELALRLAAGEKGLETDRKHLEAQLANYKFVAHLEFKWMVEEILAAGARVGATFLKEFIRQSLTELSK
jgi:hypothetical protein